MSVCALLQLPVVTIAKSALPSVLVLFLACAPFTSARCLDSCGEHCVKSSRALSFCGVLAFMCRWDRRPTGTSVPCTLGDKSSNRNKHTNNKSTFLLCEGTQKLSQHFSSRDAACHESESVKAPAWEAEKSKVMGRIATSLTHLKKPQIH